MVPHDPGNDCQTQSGTLTVLAAGEKRFKYLLTVGRGYAASTIGDVDFDSLTILVGNCGHRDLSAFGFFLESVDGVLE